MTCPRCAHWNANDEHRCVRCATRLSDTVVQSAFPHAGALALQANPIAESRPEAEAAGPRLHTSNDREFDRALPRHAGNTQQSLFAARASKRLVSIDGAETVFAPSARRLARLYKGKRSVSTSYIEQQGVLEFIPSQGPEPRRLSTSVEAVIYCDHDVASMSHRCMAAFFDLGIYAALIAVFAGILYFSCEGLTNIIAEPFTVGVLAAAAALLIIIGEAFFIATMGRTPGMRWAGLKLVNFDGREPQREQRYKRVFGGIISLLPVGIGMLWALVDEESLTWQDHISHTFPTVSSRVD